MSDLLSFANQIFAPDKGPTFRKVISFLSRDDLKNLRQYLLFNSNTSGCTTTKYTDIGSLTRQDWNVVPSHSNCTPTVSKSLLQTYKYEIKMDDTNRICGRRLE